MAKRTTWMLDRSGNFSHALAGMNSRIQHATPTAASTLQPRRRTHTGDDSATNTSSPYPKKSVLGPCAPRYPTAARPVWVLKTLTPALMIACGIDDATGQKGPTTWRGPARKYHVG